MNIEERYFNFLSDLVEDQHRICLLQHLHRINFYTFVPNDDNREVDGKKLRDIFTDTEEGHIASSLCLQGPCTMLEMLIGLSFRMENELSQGPNELSMFECFDILLQNLNIDWADDDYYLERHTKELVDYRVRCMIDRTYSFNGAGGLFPLKNARIDQRKVEIWYQMCAWLMENYNF